MIQSDGYGAATTPAANAQADMVAALVAPIAMLRFDGTNPVANYPAIAYGDLDTVRSFYTVQWMNTPNARNIWPTAESFATAVVARGAQMGINCVKWDADAWLKDWGGSTDPNAWCVLAHLQWYYAKRGVSSNCLMQIIKNRWIGHGLPTNNEWQGPNYFRQLLITYETTDSRVLVRDLPWFLEVPIAVASKFGSNDCVALQDSQDLQSHIAFPGIEREQEFGRSDYTGKVILSSWVLGRLMQGASITDGQAKALATSYGSAFISMLVAGPVAAVLAMAAVIIYAIEIVVEGYQKQDSARARARQLLVIWEQKVEEVRTATDAEVAKGVDRAELSAWIQAQVLKGLEVTSSGIAAFGAAWRVARAPKTGTTPAASEDSVGEDSNGLLIGGLAVIALVAFGSKKGK